MDSKEKARDFINKQFDYVIKEFIDDTGPDAEYELELLVEEVQNKRAGLSPDDTYIAFEADPELEKELNEEDEEDD